MFLFYTYGVQFTQTDLAEAIGASLLQSIDGYMFIRDQYVCYKFQTFSNRSFLFRMVYWVSKMQSSAEKQENMNNMNNILVFVNPFLISICFSDYDRGD